MPLLRGERRGEVKKIMGFLFLYNWNWTNLDKCHVRAVKLFCFGLPHNKEHLQRYIKWHSACKYDIWPYELIEGAELLLNKLKDPK